MSKHTPGPWTRIKDERFRNDSSAGVRGPDGIYVATALDFNRDDRDEEVEANACLISAAPELLDLLDQAITQEWEVFPDWWLTAAQAALAKAKGD